MKILKWHKKFPNEYIQEINNIKIHVTFLVL